MIPPGRSEGSLATLIRTPAIASFRWTWCVRLWSLDTLQAMRASHPARATQEWQVLQHAALRVLSELSEGMVLPLDNLQMGASLEFRVI